MSAKPRAILNREDIIGPWAGLPVAWTENDEFDEQTYREDVARCCRAGAPGIYTGGTTGEFYAMSFKEFKSITRATVEQSHAAGKPVMIGCTSTYTLGAAKHAAFAAETGADAIQIALPFWVEVPDSEVIGFFEEVSRASGGLPLSIYDTGSAKKVLTLEQHQAIKKAVPNYLMLKAIGGTVGASVEGCEELSKIVSVFVAESRWLELCPKGAAGSCSALIYWNPNVILTLWGHIQNEQWDLAQELSRKLEACVDFVVEEFGKKGFTDTAFDRLGARSSGFLSTSLRCRAPYPGPTEQDVRALRQWYQDNFPEMLEL